MSNINQFREMIVGLKNEVLSEICEQFLYDHEGAMKTLTQHCYKFGIHINELQIKNYMSEMHANGDFDEVVCFGIELSENQLYKKFHPS
tara:strand:+ start:364 stop:630 length:267 start_codon:yes stop_codon:yes gene_type:complete